MANRDVEGGSSNSNVTLLRVDVKELDIKICLKSRAFNYLKVKIL